MENFIEQFEEYKIANHGVRMPEVSIPKEEYLNLNLDEETSNEDFLTALSREGLRNKIKDGKISKDKIGEYSERFKTEMAVLVEGGFVEYILLVWQIIHFCKKNDIATGAARGSAAGSLILYLISVTDIDPIKYNLFFERFLSRARIKKNIVDGVVYLDGGLVPDVDCDISHNGRDKVINFLYELYKGKSCKLSTLSTLTTKILIKECGKIVSEFPEQKMNEISSYIPSVFGKVSSIEDSMKENEHFKHFCDENPKVIKIALKLRGLIKNKGSHASGYLVSFDKLEDCMPIEFGSNEEIVSAYDMQDAQEIAIKVDLLGLQDVTLIANVCKSAGINPNDIDPNDPFIYECLKDLNTPYGLFQISGDCNVRVAKEIRPRNLEDLSAVVALARPGALAYVQQFSDYVNKGEYQSVHKFFDDTLKDTGQIPLFQENAMSMLNKVGFSLNDSETIRKIIGKKKHEQMKEWEFKVKEKVKENNLDPEIGEVLWKVLNESASYSFNKSIGLNEYVETPQEFKPIKDIKKGDFVKAYDPETKKDKFVEVLNLHPHKAELFKFEFSNGNTIITSMEHKFLTKEAGMVPIKSIIENNFNIICDDEEEVFKDILGFEGFYKISNFGRVLSLGRIVDCGKKKYRIKSKILNSRIEKNGYRRIELKKYGVGKKKSIHRLVAESFIPNPDNKPQVNHKDGNKLNNKISNLEWATCSENHSHAHQTGLRKFRNSKNQPKGEKHHGSKLKEEDIIKIRKLNKDDGFNIMEISKMYKMNYSSIYSIIKENGWTHIA